MGPRALRCAGGSAPWRGGDDGAGGDSGASERARELAARRLDRLPESGGPLAYFGLRRLPLPAEARPALEILHQAYVATAARNAAPVSGRSRRSSRCSRRSGLPVLVLKGAALAETVYPERALRPMADIDLLIREEDLERAESRLRTVGYEVAHDPETKAELRARHHHWVFRSARADAGGIPIEVHWDLDPPGAAGRLEHPGSLRAGRTRSRSRESTRSCFRPRTLLLHVCLHLCRHRFNGGVIALCDIAAAFPDYDGRLDWGRFERRAARVGASAYAFVPLRLAADLMGADGAAVAVLARLRALDAGDRLFELARERILEEKGDVRGAAELRLRWRRRSLGGRWAAVRRVALAESPARARSCAGGAGRARCLVSGASDGSCAPLRALALGSGSSPPLGLGRRRARGRANRSSIPGAPQVCPRATLPSLLLEHGEVYARRAGKEPDVPLSQYWLAARVGLFLCSLPLRVRRQALPILLERLASSARAIDRLPRLDPDGSRRSCGESAGSGVFGLPVFPKSCLRQSLALFRFLSRMGHPVEIHFGVRKDGTDARRAQLGRRLTDGLSGRESRRGTFGRSIRIRRPRIVPHPESVSLN